MIDLRTLQWPPAGLSSDGIQRRADQGTRFVLLRACEHCLATQVTTIDGVRRCSGCRRVVLSVAGSGED